MSEDAKNPPEEDTKVQAVFDIVVNDDGNFMIALPDLGGDVINPYLAVSTEGYIILSRREINKFYLPDVPEDVVNQMRLKESVLIVEVSEDAIVREYEVPVLVETTGQEEAPA